MRLIVPLISGVVRWLKAEKRSPAACPTCNWSISCGQIFASTASRSASGTISMIGSPGGRHPADRVHRELMHHAVLGCADFDALELVFGRHLALDELADFGIDLAQFTRHLAAQILIDLDDLQLDLADLATRLGYSRDRLCTLALEARCLPFKRDQSIDLYQVLVPECPYAFELALDQLDLLNFCLLQCRVSADLLVKLPDALPELRLLAEPGTASQLEQLAFALDGSGGIGLVHAGQPSSREGDLLDLIALASQPGLARGHLVEALGDDSEIGSRDRLVEPQHNLPRANALALAHQQLADDAAGQVLHLLDIGVDHGRSRCDHGAGQLGHCCPSAHTNSEYQGDEHAPQEVAAD